MQVKIIDGQLIYEIQTSNRRKKKFLEKVNEKKKLFLRTSFWKFKFYISNNFYI